MQIYVLLIGVYDIIPPDIVGVFTELKTAREIAEQAYQQLYDKPPSWESDYRMQHYPGKWSQHLFAVIAPFEVDAIPDMADRVESVREWRKRGMPGE